MTVTSIEVSQQLIGGTVTARVHAVSISGEDSALVRKYGGAIVDPSGYFGDPADPSYPQFYVNAGPALSFFDFGEVRALFFDGLLPIETLQRHAILWCDKIRSLIQDELVRLRNLSNPPHESEIEVKLGDVFAINDPFRFDAHRVAKRVTSRDVNAPFVDGIVLSSGGVGDVRAATTVVGKITTTTAPLSGTDILMLSSAGRLTPVTPSVIAGDVWYCVVMRAIDATSFIFHPQPPIRL